MGKRTRIYWIAVLLLCALGAYVLISPPPEPRVENRPLSEWLADLDHSQRGTYNLTNRPKAEAAVRQMDTNAVPHLVRLMNRRDSGAGLWIRSILTKLSITQARPAADKIRWRAVMATRLLGTNAIAARPTVIALLSDSHPHVRASAIYTLEGIDPGSRSTTHHLLQALTDPDKYVQTEACRALLNHSLESPTPSEVWALIKSPAPGVQIAAMQLIRSIEGSDNAIPTLADWIEDSDPQLAHYAIGTSGTLTNHTTRLLPLLRRATQSSALTLRLAATNALAQLQGVAISKPTEEKLGAFKFIGVSAQKILTTMESVFEKKLIISPNVDQAPANLTIISTAPVTTKEAVQLIKASLEEQAGLEFTETEDGSIRVHFKGFNK